MSATVSTVSKSTVSKSPVSKPPTLLSSLFKAGPALTPEQIADLLAESSSAVALAANGDESIRDADLRTSEARRVLTDTANAAKTVRSQVGESRVTFARLVLLTTTSKVRSVKSVNASDLAVALGIGKSYVSQVATNAAAMYALAGTGQWSPAMYTEVDAARRARALPALVQGALDLAEVRTRAESVGTKSNKSTVVKASTSEVKEVRAVVAPVKAAPKVTPVKSAATVRGILHRALDALSEVESMSAADRDALLTTLRILTRGVQVVTVVEDGPATFDPDTDTSV